MNLTSGTFTVPVDGIYNFQFSGLRDASAPYLHVSLQVNDQSIGDAETGFDDNTRTSVGYSLSASLRLKSGNTVRLYNSGSSVLYDNGGHKSHFTGWLVEEDLSTVVGL